MTKIKDFASRVRRVCAGNAQLMLFLLVALIFLGMLTWTGPEQSRRQKMAAAAADMALIETPIPSVDNTPTPGPTAIPDEWQTNYTQTNGVAIGGIVLVLIVIGGAMAVLTRKKPAEQK